MSDALSMSTISPASASPPIVQSAAFEREIVAIDVASLDKENREWTVKYLDGSRMRLAREQEADRPDFVMISYLKREIATYQELLERCAGAS